MRIESVRIENLRAIKDQTVYFDDYTALIGPNGAGKSTVLFALNVFFQEAQAGSTSAKALTKEDYHKQDTTKPIRITVTFTNLSEEASKTLGHYYRQGRLVFTAQATFDDSTGQVRVNHFGQRMVMKAFAPYFEAVQAKTSVPDLKPIYKRIRDEFLELPNESTGTGMERALRDYEERHPELCELIESAAKPYGFGGAGDRLEDFIQWVYVPAVKDAAQEQQEGKETALGKLLARSVRAEVDFKASLQGIEDDARAKYEELVGSKQDLLEGLAGKLTESVQRVAHPDAGVQLNWDQDAKKAVSVTEPYVLARVQEFGLDPHLIARCGHGLQRSYLLALLQVLADVDAEDAPTLILAVEEAELFQHPPQARHLAGVLQSLATGNSQVLVTTHSPYFVSAQRLESIRLVRRDRVSGEALVAQCKWDDVRSGMAEALGEVVPDRVVQAAKLAPDLMKGLDEMFFAQALVLVESPEDGAYIEAHAAVTSRSEDFRAAGVSIVPVHGKSCMLRPLSIAKALGIPVLCIFDADGDCSECEKENNEKQNTALLNAVDLSDRDAFPAEVLMEAGCVVWPNSIDKHVGEDWPIGAKESAWDAARAVFGGEGGMKKNPIAVAEFVRAAKEAGHTCDHLGSVVNVILELVPPRADRAAGLTQETL